MASIRWTVDARRDIHAIREYVALYSPTYAATLIEGILSAVSRLEHFPLSGRIVPEFENEAIRELIVGDYRVVYALEREGVDILIVAHGSRDIFSQS